MSGYQTLAAFYDRFTGDVDYPAMADHLLALFERHGTRPETVLDLACGSGSLTVELLRRGVDVIGVDGSADMLLEARDKVAALGGEALFLQQDMRRLDLYGTVNGCVCVLDSVNHLVKTADVGETFRRVSLFVEPGGLFIFDVNTPYKHRQVLADRTFAAEEEGTVCLWQNRLIDRTCEIETVLDFFEEQPDGSYLRGTDAVRERAYALPTLQRLLKQAEFTPLAVYGAGTLLPPEPDCRRWVIVARNDTKRYEEN